MKCPVLFSELTATSELSEYDPEEAILLGDMLSRARKYIKSHKWCPDISHEFIGYGVGGVLALLLFHFDSTIDGSDEWLWVIEGDLPSAYFVTDQSRDVRSALCTYCTLMEEWIIAVEGQKRLDDVFPVAVPADSTSVAMLKTRIDYIREHIITSL